MINDKYIWKSKYAEYPFEQNQPHCYIDQYGKPYTKKNISDALRTPSKHREFFDLEFKRVSINSNEIKEIQ